MEVNGQLHALAVLPPWKEPLVPKDRRLGGPQGWTGCIGRVSQPCQEMNPGYPAHSLVSILTELPWFYMVDM